MTWGWSDLVVRSRMGQEWSRVFRRGRSRCRWGWLLAGGQSVGGRSGMGHDGLAGIWVRQVGFDNVCG